MGEDIAFRQEISDFLKHHAISMGKIAFSYFRNLSEDDVEQKEGYVDDTVTIADKKNRAHIVAAVNNRYGDRVIMLTEETSENFPYTVEDLMQLKKPIIIIDELDGTRNFSKGIPFFCIPMAFAEFIDGAYEVTAGVVYNPVTEELFHAQKDNPAYVEYHKKNCGSDLIRLSKKEEGKRILKVSETEMFFQDDTPFNMAGNRKTFPIDYPAEYYRVLEVMEAVRDKNPKTTEKNYKHCCALEMLDVAQGKVDVYLNGKSANWDYAAAFMILQQAGGKGYLARTTKQLLTLKTPWALQFDKPGAYYPTVFTNGTIDEQFIGYIGKINETKQR